MNKMTKKQAGMYDSYLRSNATTLRDVYASYSYKKARAEESILRQMDKLNGCDPRIIGGSCHFFSMGFMYPCPVTGEMRLRYYTGMNTYDFAITEEV